MSIYFVEILAFLKFLPGNFSKLLFKLFDGLLIVVTFMYILDLLALMNRFICSQSHSNIKMSISSVLKIGVLNWQSLNWQSLF